MIGPIERRLYGTSFCNRPHDLDTGKPFDHDCDTLPPAGLEAEMAGSIEEAIQIFSERKGRFVP